MRGRRVIEMRWSEGMWMGYENEEGEEKEEVMEKSTTYGDEKGRGR